MDENNHDPDFYFGGIRLITESDLIEIKAMCSPDGPIGCSAGIEYECVSGRIRAMGSC